MKEFINGYEACMKTVMKTLDDSCNQAITVKDCKNNECIIRSYIDSESACNQLEVTMKAELEALKNKVIKL